MHSLQPTGTTRREEKKLKVHGLTALQSRYHLALAAVSFRPFFSCLVSLMGGRRDGTPEIPPRYEHAPFPHGERQRGTTIYLSGFLLWWRRGVRMGEGGGKGLPIKTSQSMGVCVCVDVRARPHSPTLAQQVSDLHPVVKHTGWKK